MLDDNLIHMSVWHWQEYVDIIWIISVMDYYVII